MSNPFAEAERLGNVLVIDEHLWWDEGEQEKTKEKIKNFLPEYKWQNEFSDQRRALLFKPGYYQGCGFELGYYQQMVGLGAAATAVRFVGYTDPKDSSFPHSGPNVPDLNPSRPDSCRSGGRMALDTFWRSAENFSTENGDGINWHVSQAAPLRRIKCDGKLRLANGGQSYSSGGFIANAEVGSVDYGTQQQFYHRNVKFDSPPGCPGFNGVYSGCVNPPNEGNPNVCVEPKLRTRVEKPFIVFNDNGKYELHVPPPTTNTSEGPNLGPIDPKDVRTFEKVTVVNPGPNATEVQDTLQKALDQGNDIIITPGIYDLKSSLIVNKGGTTSATYKNQVILGLGMATLAAPLDGSPCIKVEGNSEGIRIAGLLLQASILTNGPYQGSSLLDFGTSGVKDDGNPANPGLLSDVFARVGKCSASSSRAVSVETMVRIYSSNVVGDNLWLWRADHDKGVDGQIDTLMRLNTEGKCDTALHVYGNNVTMYGLFGEHTQKEITIWDGDNGEIHFFQSELNYYTDRNDLKAVNASIGFRVGTNVQQFYGSAIGVYSCFGVGDNNTVNVPYGIQIPADRPNVLLKRPFTHQLGNPGHDHVLKVGYGSETPLGGKSVRFGTQRLEGTGPGKRGPPFNL